MGRTPPHTRSSPRCPDQPCAWRLMDLRTALRTSPSLHKHLLRYAEAFNVQVAYTALSHGSYTIEERLARWLLMCHDRLDGDDLPLVHEFLSMMLGVRRPGVTIAVQTCAGCDPRRRREMEITRLPAVRRKQGPDGIAVVVDPENRAAASHDADEGLGVVLR